MKQELKNDVQTMEKRLSGRIDRLEGKVDHNHMMVCVKLENINKRLDDVEVVELPKIRKKVGMR